MKFAQVTAGVGVGLVCLLAWPLEAVGAGGPRGWCGTARLQARDAKWAHDEERARRERTAAPRTLAHTSSTRAHTADADNGQIAVLEDRGDLALLRNLFDLAGAGLQFAPGAAYGVSRVDRPVAATGGNKLALGDDDTREVTLPFEFPFFGQSYGRVWVNSDGNLTFGAGDSASTARNVGRLLAGPPRLAAFFADLDPASGGSVTFASAADSATFTWEGVPLFDKRDSNSFQMTLHRDGRVDFLYDTKIGTPDEGVVGIAPGKEQGGLTALDLSASAAKSGPGALAETFRASDTLDTVAVARRFYETHADDYQQLVIYTSRRLVEPGVFAYQLVVRNADRGLGAAVEDLSRDFGSAGRLESFVTMDAWTKYSDDLAVPINGDDTTLSVLAHEVGHRWLAHARFRDGAADSSDLLGRQQAHWSFFMHSSGSHLEGNDIEDLGAGRFRTRASSVRYSALDQYLMGLRAPSEVAPFFVVRNPIASNNDATRGPRAGETFDGTRKDVTIDDVIAALGPRDPAPLGWSSPFRQAFIYVAVGGPAEATALARVERIRAAFPAFFAQSTDGRGAVDSRLR